MKGTRATHLILLSVVLAGIVSACSSSGASNGEATSDGALGASGGSVTETIGSGNPVAVGQDIWWLQAVPSNETPEPITLRSITPLVAADARHLADVDVEMAPRDVSSETFAPLGVYTKTPLTGRFLSHPCVEQPTEPVEAYILRPRLDGDASAVAIHFHAKSPGKFRLDGLRVEYEQDGVVHVQDLHHAFEFTIANGEPFTSITDRNCPE